MYGVIEIAQRDIDRHLHLEIAHRLADVDPIPCGLLLQGGDHRPVCIHLDGLRGGREGGQCMWWRKARVEKEEMATGFIDTGLQVEQDAKRVKPTKKRLIPEGTSL